MKKISMTTFAVALLVAGGANAANIASPIYMPKADTMYSKTTVEFGGLRNDNADFSIGEEIGYGISDTLTVRGYTGYTFGDEDPFEAEYGMADLGLGITYRAMNDGMFTLDLKGDYIIDISSDQSTAMPGSYGSADTDNLTAAIEAGIHMKDLTIAGEIGYTYYLDDENDFFGNNLQDDASTEFYILEAQWRFAPEWSANLRYHYQDMDPEFDLDKSTWTAQANYHIDEDMVAGVFYSYDNIADTDDLEDNVVGVKFATQW